MSSLLRADFEETGREQERLRQTAIFTVALTAPAAVGMVFPPVTVIWLALSAAIGFLFGSKTAFILALVITYLITAAAVWVAMIIFENRYFDDFR